MIYAIIAVGIILIDRIFAVLSYKELERKLFKDINWVSSNYYKLSPKVEQIEQSLGVLQMKQRQDFSWTQGEIDGIPNRFASIEKQIDTDFKLNNRSILALCDRLDKLEKSNKKKRK